MFLMSNIHFLSSCELESASGLIGEKRAQAMLREAPVACAKAAEKEVLNGN